jgi:hypothetical protein
MSTVHKDNPPQCYRDSTLVLPHFAQTIWKEETIQLRGGPLAPGVHAIVIQQ